MRLTCHCQAKTLATSTKGRPLFFMKITAPFVVDLELLLGADFISQSEQLAPYFQNATEFSPETILGVAKPQTVSQVQNIMHLAKKQGHNVYTFSTGMNWGLGSRIPLEGDCLLLDMSGLKAIRAVSEDYRYAIIESGVTQQELSEYLEAKGLNVILPVTGSSPSSSIVGNSLERGTTFLTHRAADLRNLEVILPDGEMIRTGFWETSDGKGSVGEELHYRYGNGPDTTGLFVQSNLGIVTAMVIELLPKPATTCMFWASVKENDLAEFTDRTKALHRNGALRRIMHIGNEKRMKITGKGVTADSYWVAMAALQGAPGLVEWQKETLKSELSTLVSEMRFVSQEDDLTNDPVMAQMLALHCGKPTTIFLQAMYKSEDSGEPGTDFNVDQGSVGMLCCLPVFPMHGKTILQAIKLANQIAEAHGFMLASTINPVNDLYAESVINLYFNRRSDTERANAHQCNNLIHEKLAEMGIRFYRLDVKEMQNGYHNPTAIPLARLLKSRLDPENRLSARKYGV